MDNLRSSSEFRVLSLEEVEAVAGNGDVQYYNGTTLVTEHYDRDGWFTGASYSRADGSGSWFDMAGGSGSWAASGWSSGAYGYASGGFGYMGGVGGISQVAGGDTYGYIGIGTPGPSGSVGIDADGDLSGWSINLPAGITGLGVDPGTGTVTSIELGTSPSITYTVNLSDIGRDFVNMAYEFSSGFVQTYYPEQLWNPDYYQQPQQ